MSKKSSTMVKRKFSFDIPRLKIGGQGKVDKNNYPTDAYANASSVDSPPQTPKSVRPPLTPRTDHELRLACTYVLQDFKPSHQIYEEQYGKSQSREARPDADYFTSRQAAVDTTDDEDDAVPPPVVRTIVRKQIGRAHLEQDLNSVVDAGNLRSKQTLGTDNLIDDGDHTRIKSQTIELLERASVVSPEPVESKTIRSHSRNESQLLQRNSSTSNKNYTADQLKNDPRSESADTNVSTPQTEEGGIEYPWTTSTAPTSVGVTPARNSVRASQVRLSGSESGSKFLAADTEWMMQELEKHKKAQAEAKAQQELEEQVLASLGVDATPTQGRPTAPPNSAVRRKPVPRTSTDGTSFMPPVPPMNTRQSSDVGYVESDRRPPVPQLDSRQSTEIARSASRKRRSTPRSESRHENMLRPESRLSRRGQQVDEDSAPPSRASSRARDFKLFFMPSSLQTPGDESAAVSRSPSRSRSITRRLQNYVRSNSGAVSPNGSAAESRPDSRARSIESSRSDVSALAPSVASSTTKKWRNWKPFHRNQGSNSSTEPSRPPTTNSTKHRRTASGDNHQAQKPAINLNRELPPLPSLDQWQYAEAEPSGTPPIEVEPERPKHIVQMASPPRERVKRDKVSFREDQPVRDDAAEAPVIHRRPGTLKLSTSVRRSSTKQQSRNSVQTVSSPNTPIVPSELPFSALLEPCDGDFAHVDPHDPISLPTSPMPTREEKKERRHSKRPPNMSEPNLHEQLNDHQSTNTRTAKPHVVNFSRTPSNPTNTALYRRAVRQSYVPTPSSSELAVNSHERRPSDQVNFSRKPSADDYVRAHDTRFPNAVEIKPAAVKIPPNFASTSSAPVKDKGGKKKWWLPGKTAKKEESWMDQVVKSGSRSGLILAEGGAGQAIVRY